MTQEFENILRDRDVQTLIVAMQYWPVIKPAINASGKLTYPVLGAVGIREEQFLRLLTDLSDHGVLIKKISSRLVTCPNCGGLNVNLRALCPSCGKPLLQPHDFLEHSCGLTAPREKFVIVSMNLLKCPNCQGQFRIQDVGKVKIKARVYECDNCKTSTEDFKMIITCNSCTAEFNLDSGRFGDIYEYSLNEESAVLTKTMNAIVRFAPLADVLKRNGFQVQMPGQIVGSSGINHLSNIVARKNLSDGKQIVTLIDCVLSDSVVSAAQVMGLTPKLLDVKPDLAIFVAIPKLDDKAVILSKQVNLTTIEVADIAEAAAKIKQLLTERGMSS